MLFAENGHRTVTEMVIKFNLNPPETSPTESDEPVFLGVDFYDLDVVEVTGETSYFPGNGFWYVKTREGEWVRLEYANKEERTAIRDEIRHLVIAFEKRMGKKWTSPERVR